jgi:hypothetical protein
MNELIPQDYIEKRIYLIRGHKVMIDEDLADFSGVETKIFNRSVKRNNDRFPEDFMFQLTKEETESLRFQIGTQKSRGVVVVVIFLMYLLSKELLCSRVFFQAKEPFR